MSNYIDKDLFPKDCPPSEANCVNQTFYRLCRSRPPKNDVDFKSKKAQGQKPKKGYTECDSCGLSVWGTLSNCLQMALQPFGRKLENPDEILVMELALQPEHGPVINSGDNDDHYSWWRTNKFDTQNVLISTHERSS